MAITLTAGDFSGVIQGYLRSGNSVGVPATGSISAEPAAGKTLDYLYTGSSGAGLAFVGDWSAIAAPTLTVNGTPWTVGTGSYNSGANVTEYAVTGYGAGFSNGVGYTVDLTMVAYAGPTWVGATSGVGSNNTFNITFATSGRASGDLLVIAVMTANQPITAPTGFVQEGATQFRGTAGVGGAVALQLFTKVSDGTETTIAIADGGDIQYAVGTVFRGVSGAAVAIEASAGNNVAAATSVTFGGVTTTVGDCLVVTFVATDRDSAGPSFSAQANASLANLTERFDAGTATGTGGGLAIYTGEKQVAGATGNTTATQAASAAYCWITLALKNSAGGGASAPVGRSDETDSALSLARRLTRAVGLGDSASSALGLPPKLVRTVGLAAESDTASALSFAGTAGRSIETDAALALAPVGLRAVGRSDEANGALALTRSLIRPVGVSSAGETALSLPAVLLAAVARAVEQDAALGLSSGGAALPLGRADTVDSALPLSPLLRAAAGVAVEAGVSLPLAAASRRAVGLATSSEAAIARVIGLPVGLGVETNVAVMRGTGAPVAAANENDAAFALGIASPVGAAAETSEALARPSVVPLPTPAERSITGTIEDRTAAAPQEPSRSIDGVTEPRSAASPPQPSRVATAVTERRVAS